MRAERHVLERLRGHVRTGLHVMHEHVKVLTHQQDNHVRPGLLDSSVRPVDFCEAASCLQEAVESCRLNQACRSRLII